MLYETAVSVRAAGACLLRGGAWKPRTSPYAFQGLGEQALEMLAEVRVVTRSSAVRGGRAAVVPVRRRVRRAAVGKLHDRSDPRRCGRGIEVRPERHRRGVDPRVTLSSGLSDVTLEMIRTVQSHPAALAQCRRFPRTHAWMRARSARHSGRGPARCARTRHSGRRDRRRAVAARYGRSILAQHIRDDAANRTRFLVLTAPGGNIALDKRAAAAYPLRP